MKLTPMEKALMIGMTCNDYTDGTEGSWGQWTWAVIDASGIDPKKARGVLSSLIQKGMVTEETFARPVNDYCLYFTEAGKVAARELLAAPAVVDIDREPENADWTKPVEPRKETALGKW